MKKFSFKNIKIRRDFISNINFKKFEPNIKEFKYSTFLIRQSPLAMAGLIIIFMLIAVAIFAPFIAPYGPEEHLWDQNKQPPSLDHLFGTDETGGDIFSKVVWGSRVTIEIGVIVVVGGLVIGIILGAIAGYFGGYIDELVMRITDMFLSIPSLILAMAVAAILGKSIQNVMIALIVVWWPPYTRLVRGQILSIRENQYIEAARSIGASNSRIIIKHILPNALSPMIVQSTMDLGSAILTAAGLSFLGFGAGPGAAEWGRMVSDSRNYFVQYPWMMIFPGIAIFITVLGFNLVGDGLRDILDPHLRRGGGKL